MEEMLVFISAMWLIASQDFSAFMFCESFKYYISLPSVSGR
jgi:hypothetical protein